MEIPNQNKETIYKLNLFDMESSIVEMIYFIIANFFLIAHISCFVEDTIINEVEDKSDKVAAQFITGIAFLANVSVGMYMNSMPEICEIGFPIIVMLHLIFEWKFTGKFTILQFVTALILDAMCMFIPYIYFPRFIIAM